MAVRTIDCTACGSSVPYGRLSCPACGELLASVAGAMRPLASVGGPSSAASPSVEPREPVPDLTLPQIEPTDGPATETATETGMEAGPERGIEPTDDDAERGHADRSWPPAIGDARAGGAVPQPRDAAPEPAWPASIQPSAVGTSPALPGAYLPPSPPPPIHAPAFASAAPAVADGPALPAPARAWAGSRADEPQATGNARPSATDELRALTDPAKRDEMIGWLAIAGGTLASLGFLLPWSRVVIGSDGIGYFASWGFAGPGHLLVVVALLAVVALALVGVRVPVAIRIGAPGLFLGGLIIGVVWPYAIGPLGALPGVWLSLFGAATLAVASIAALVGTRHGGRAQDV